MLHRMHPMTQETRLSEWAADIRAINDTKLTPEHKRRAFNHLQDLVAFNNIAFYTGFLFSFLDASHVFPWLMMGLSISSHWTTVSHHVSHGGYMANNSDDTEKNHNNKYNRFRYGAKMRRVYDWMDYILPEAWHCVTMAAEFIFYAILCVVFVGYVVVMHVIKRNETNTRS